jgi:hypothetical protein
MLPPKKKHAHLEDAVTTVVKGSMRPAPRSERPEPVSELEGESADSVTRMMPSRMASDMPPPPSSKPASSKPAKSIRPNVSFRPSSEVTTYRPLAAPADGTPVAASVSDADRVKAQIKAVRAARAAEKAVREADTDPRVDPPASSVTAGIIIKGRPTGSWAMALVAMGLFGGLLTAVLARGDGDSIVAAGAAFVDPGQAAQITAAHALQPFQPPTETTATQAPSVADTREIVPTVVVAPVVETKMIAKPAPVAAARPVAPKVAAPAAEKPVAAITPAAAPKPVVAAAPPAPKAPAKPKAPATDNMASAAAADALAKAQLESSLQ